jgi:hypothetical protein
MARCGGIGRRISLASLTANFEGDLEQCGRQIRGEGAEAVIGMMATAA